MTTKRLLTALDSMRARHIFLWAVGLSVFVPSILAARWRPLWYDELFTMHVASLPTFVDTIRALLAGADIHPPLDFALRHASIAVFGASPEAFRGPSAAAFVVGMFAIYAYVRRHASFLAAAAALLLPACSAVTFFSYEGRGYALLFASAPVALLAWQRSVEPSRRPRHLALLVLALCVGPCSHYYGVLNFVPVSAGEAWRCWRRRKVDAAIVAMIAVAGLLTLMLLWPFARAAMSMTGVFWASGFRAGDLHYYYRGLLETGGMAAVVACASAALLTAPVLRRVPRTAWPAIPQHEFVAALLLALTPFSAYLLARFFTGALIPRYTITLVPGVAILSGYALAYAAVSWRAAAGAIVALLAVFGLWQNASAALAYRGSEAMPADVRRILRASPLPIAFDSPHQFLEFAHYEPQLATRRFFYPMDASTALAIRGFNNDEIALRGLSRIWPLNVVDYGTFKAEYGEFLVVYTEGFWPSLVKALERDGYCLQFAGRSGQTAFIRAFPGCGGMP